LILFESPTYLWFFPWTPTLFFLEDWNITVCLGAIRLITSYLVPFFLPLQTFFSFTEPHSPQAAVTLLHRFPVPTPGRFLPFPRNFFLPPSVHFSVRCNTGGFPFIVLVGLWSLSPDDPLVFFASSFFATVNSWFQVPVLRSTGRGFQLLPPPFLSTGNSPHKVPLTPFLCDPPV